MKFDRAGRRCHANNIITMLLAGIYFSTLLSFSPPAHAQTSILPGVYLPSSYGATCNGIADDEPAFAAAVAAASGAGGGTVVIPPTGCRLAESLIVPTGVTLQGFAFNPQNPALGSRFICDMTVTPCLQLGRDSKNDVVAAKGFSVTRVSGGAPPPGSVGVLVKDAYNILLEDVGSYLSAEGFYFKADTQYGISAIVSRIYGGNISDNYIVIDSWPELKISDCRMGQNGGDSFASGNAMIKITGGLPSSSPYSGIGPNTITVDKCTFLNGSASPGPAYGISFENVVGGDVHAGGYKFTNNHFENIKTAYVSLDGASTPLRNLTMNGNTFNSVGPENFSISPYAVIENWQLIGNQFLGSSFYLNQTNAIINYLEISGNTIGGPAIIGGTAGSTANIHGNIFTGSLVVAGNWGALSVDGADAISSGTVTNNASGNVSFSGPYNFPWTPSLTINGSSSGISQVTSGTYTVSDKQVTASFIITLTSVSGSGIVGMAGLPYAARSTAITTGGGFFGFTANLLNAPQTLGLSVNPGTTSLNFSQMTSSGVTSVSSAILTNTTKLSGTIIYQLP
ncbi:MAG: hypothetical protein P4L64_11320 [Caulobacteraceae bacterium]|nr:hypothetical protein [Caulobacteraceae bacterium]